MQVDSSGISITPEVIAAAWAAPMMTSWVKHVLPSQISYASIPGTSTSIQTPDAVAMLIHDMGAGSHYVQYSAEGNTTITAGPLSIPNGGFTDVESEPATIADDGTVHLNFSFGTLTLGGTWSWQQAWAEYSTLGNKIGGGVSNDTEALGATFSGSGYFVASMGEKLSITKAVLNGEVPQLSASGSIPQWLLDFSGFEILLGQLAASCQAALGGLSFIPDQVSADFVDRLLLEIHGPSSWSTGCWARVAPGGLNWTRPYTRLPQGMGGFFQPMQVTDPKTQKLVSSLQDYQVADTQLLQRVSISQQTTSGSNTFWVITGGDGCGYLQMEKNAAGASAEFLGFQQIYDNSGNQFKVRRMAVAAMPNGDAQIVAIGLDGNVWHTIYFSATNTFQKSWGQIYGSALDVSIAAMPNGDSQVVVVGTDHAVYHSMRFADGSWQPFAQPPQADNEYSNASISVDPATGDAHLLLLTMAQLQPGPPQELYCITRFASPASWGSPVGQNEMQNIAQLDNEAYEVAGAACADHSVHATVISHTNMATIDILHYWRDPATKQWEPSNAPGLDSDSIPRSISLCAAWDPQVQAYNAALQYSTEA